MISEHQTSIVAADNREISNKCSISQHKTNRLHDHDWDLHIYQRLQNRRQPKPHQKQEDQMDLTEVLLTLNLIFVNLWGSRFFCNSTSHQWLLNLNHVSLSFWRAAPWRQKLGTPSQILHLSTESLHHRLCKNVGLLPGLYTGRATSKISWFSTSPSTSTKLPVSRKFWDL